MEIYSKPALKLFDAKTLTEAMGPVFTQYATLNVYGGRTAQLNTNQSAEYKIAQIDTNYKVLHLKEVENA